MEGKKAKRDARSQNAYSGRAVRANNGGSAPGPPGSGLGPLGGALPASMMQPLEAELEDESERMPLALGLGHVMASLLRAGYLCLPLVLCWRLRRAVPGGSSGLTGLPAPSPAALQPPRWRAPP
jgi:hypothetical protein